MRFLSWFKTNRRPVLILLCGLILFIILSFIFFPNKIVNSAGVIFGEDPNTGDFIIRFGPDVRFRITGTGVLSAKTITAENINGTSNAGDISSGQFGSKVGGGNYSFPGNVGIGTTNPLTTLDVIGDIKAANIHPVAATLWPEEFTSLVGTFSYNPTEQQMHGGFWESDGTKGAALEGNFFLKSGSYKISILGAINQFKGMIDWYVDDSLEVSHQDWYSKTPSYNVIKSADVTISTDGVHRLKGVVNNKNPQSHSYTISLTKIWIK